MSDDNEKKVTVIYYCDYSLELLHQVKSFPVSESGRIILSDEFKQGKSIVAVCDGEIDILNKTGDRTLPFDPDADSDDK